MVNDLVTSKGTFVNKKHAAHLTDGVCDQYTMVLESQLKKHVKVELAELHDAIYLIPSGKGIAEKRKAGLCKLISRHYRRMLHLILLIKHMYDLEHGGENSLAGTTIRNIRVEGRVMEIRFCKVEQDLDFTNLKGFDLFCKEFLTGVERETLLHNMRMIFGRKKKSAVAEYAVCGDTLLTGVEYAEILRERGAKCNKVRHKEFVTFVEGKTGLDYGIKLAKRNPILNIDACRETDSMLVDMSAAGSKEVKRVYEKMQTDYADNLAAVVKCMDQLVTSGSDSGKYVLRDLGNKQLNLVQKRIKSLVAQFYLRSISNFHFLLATAHHATHFKVAI